MTFAILLVVFWVAPILVAESIGKGRHRNGLWYGLFLGWIGVIIVALLPPLRDAGHPSLSTVDAGKGHMNRYINGKREVVILGAIIVAVFLGYQHFHNTAATTNPNTLATTIGAAWCADSGYALKNRLDDSQDELYSCNMPNGSYRCVTDDGLAKDVTVEAKLVFAQTLGSDKPDCVAN